MTRLSHLLLLCFISCLGYLNAQEQLGLRLDNYGGVNTILLNPAAGVYSPFSWDVNLAGADVFVENNYAFFENTHLPELLRQLENEVEIRPEIDDESMVDPNSLIVDFYRERKKRFLSIATNITGPSALIQLPNRQAVGILTRARAATYSQKIPASLNYYEFENIAVFDNFSVTPFQLTSVAWSELGVHYSRSFDTYEGEAAVGINLKFLQGYESVYFSNESPFRLTRLPNDSIQANATNLDYGFTNANIQGEDFNLNRNGTGFSADIGFNFTIAEYADNYRWRIGAALQDIGRINFNQNAERYQLNTDTLVDLVSSNYEQYNDIEQLDDVVDFFNQDVIGDTLANNLGSPSFKVWLPTALSIQADYSINEYLFINATYIQRLNLPGAALQRGNLLALTPRFESRWFSASLPMATYNWQDFRMGLALRLAFLTIGSDNLGSLVSRSNFTGTDFYFALKINPFKVNFGGRAKRKRGKVLCPAISG